MHLIISLKIINKIKDFKYIHTNILDFTSIDIRRETNLTLNDITYYPC